MNTLIYGQIGSGKTYFAISDFIIPALRQGRFIYTNIDFGHKFEFDIWHKFSHYIGKDISKFIQVIPDTKQFLDKLRLVAYDERGCQLPTGSVVVIDEAHQIFNYLETNYISKQVYEFLAYSRHFNIDLVFITQSPELLSKFVNNLCNNFISVYNLKQNSSLMKNSFILEYYSIYKGMRLQKRIRKFDPKIFALYRSFISDTDEGVFKRGLLLEGWGKVAFGLALVFISFIFVLKTGLGYLKF